MMSFRSTQGYATARIFDLKLLSSGSLGMSPQCPSQLYFEPWYTQRNPSSSLRPKKRDAPRCGQWFWIIPILPEVTRNAIRFSPSSRTRTGAPSRSGSSLDIRAGIQYWRNRFPVGVSRPTRQSSSLSSLDSIVVSFALRDYATVGVRTLPCTSRRTSTTTASTTAVIISAATAASSSLPFDHWLRNSVGSTVDLAPYRNATVARSLNETVNWITHPATKPFFTKGSQILRNV